METIVMALFAVLVGPLTSWLMAKLRLASTWVEGLSVWAKRAVVAGIGIVLAFVGSVFGVPLPAELGAITPEVLTGLLTAIVAHITHKLAS